MNRSKQTIPRPIDSAFSRGYGYLNPHHPKKTHATCRRNPRNSHLHSFDNAFPRLDCYLCSDRAGCGSSILRAPSMQQWTTFSAQQCCHPAPNRGGSTQSREFNTGNSGYPQPQPLLPRRLRWQLFCHGSCSSRSSWHTYLLSPSQLPSILNLAHMCYIAGGYKPRLCTRWNFLHPHQRDSHCQSELVQSGHCLC